MNLNWISQEPLPVELLRNGEKLGDAIARELLDQGWIVVSVQGTRSRANPFTKVLELALTRPDGTRLDSRQQARLVQHEWTHVRQWGRTWQSRWWRGLLYLLSRRVRAQVEAEAVAHVAYLHAVAVTGAHGYAEAQRSLSPGVYKLWGWRWPYMTGLSKEEVERDAMQRFNRLWWGTAKREQESA